MDKSWSNFIQNFNESSRYLTKDLSIPHFWFKQNLIFINFINEQKFLLLPKFAVTYWLAIVKKTVATELSEVQSYTTLSSK